VGNQFHSGSVLVSTSEDEGACEHPWGLPADRLAELDAGGTVNVARLRVPNSATWIGTEVDGGFFAELRPFNALEVVSNGSVPSAAIGMIRPGQPGCGAGHGAFVSMRLGGGPFPGQGPAEPPARPVLDAGETLQLAGPGGRHIILEKDEHWDWTGMYRPDDSVELPQGFFDGGEWTFAAPGGDGLGPFAVPIAVPHPVRGEVPDVIDRTEDARVAWNAGQLGEGEIEVSLFIRGESRPDPDNPGATITEYDRLACYANLADGELTIPAEILSRLPASENATLSIGPWLPQGFTVRFEIPGVDHATFSQSSRYSQRVAVE
jgi:hypothetical protein